MALTSARQAIVIAELRYIHTYLISLANEIDLAAPLTDKRGFTYQTTARTAE